jgi:hypothetical protein
MTCPVEGDRCRAEHVAPKLSEAEQAGADFEAHCPVCRHGGFRISRASRSRYRHVWVCTCRRCRCDPAAIRAEMMRLGVRSGCLGGYGVDLTAGSDPIAAAALREAVDLVLSWPGLDPSMMRLILAEARGDKVPDEYGEFAKFARAIGIGKSHAYNLAKLNCRPSGCPSPGGGSADA